MKKLSLAMISALFVAAGCGEDKPEEIICPMGTVRAGNNCVAATPDSGVPGNDSGMIDNDSGGGGQDSGGGGEDAGGGEDGGIEGSATISALSIDFGRLVAGGTQERAITVENATAMDVVINVGIVSGPQGGDFGVTSSDPIPPSGIVMQPGKQITFTFAFTPRGSGTRMGAIAFELCEHGCAATVTLAGIGLDDAITCAPTALDFMLVNPNSCAMKAVDCTNASDYDGMIGAAGLHAGSSAAFSVSPSATFPITVGAQLSASIDVLYCPTGLTTDTGTLDVTTDHPDALRAIKTVMLSGMGGGPDLSCTESSLSFGTVAVGQTVTRTVHCQNAGNAALNVTAIALGAASAPDLSIVGGMPQMLAPLGAMTVVVQYAPAAAGMSMGTLEISSDDRDTPVLSISMSGEAVPDNGCTLAIAPSPLDFGAVRVNDVAHLAAVFHNTGTGACTVNLMGFTSGTAAAYTLDTTPGSVSVNPGDSFNVDVAFAPTAAQAYTGGISVMTTDLARPASLTIALNGSGVANYPLLAQPSSLDFGVVPFGCADPAMRVVRVTNGGAATSLVAAIESGSSAAYTVNSTTSVTIAVPANGTIELDVGFAPSAAGAHTGRLRLTPGALPPIFVPLSGQADATGHNVQTFTSPGAQVIDLLLVVDDSCSMAEEQASLSMTAATLIARADASGADYHIAVTTTDPGTLAPAPAAGTLRGTPAVITGASATRIQDLQNAINVGTLGSPDEMGLLTASQAVTNAMLLSGANAGFLRADGELVILVLSDEEDSSPDPLAIQPVSTFVTQLLARPVGLPGAVRFYSISGGAQGCNGTGGNATAQTRYSEADTLLGGFDRSICDPNYTQFITDIADAAFDPTRAIYQLGAPPAPGTIQVFVDNVASPAANWGVDYALGRVVFAPGHSPSAMSTVRIEYDSFCVPSTCGNGTHQVGEQCDDGNLTNTDSCPITCYSAFCGDGFVLANTEQCDDSNNISGDGCNSSCVVEGCGNGFIEPGEQCDNGAMNSNTAPNACRLNCVAAGCGDTVIDSGEQCDDANFDDTDACVSCQNARCGDGAVHIGVEACDDGNAINNDLCSNACTFNLNSFTITTVANQPLTPLAGGTAIAWPFGGDEDIVAQSIGFPFNYLGAAVTDVYVVSNGYLAFEMPSAATYSNVAVPNAAQPNAFVAWWWDDLDFGRALPGNTVSATTQLVGNAPNRRRVFTFVNVPHWNLGDTVISAEVTLFEGTNVIEVHYGMTAAAGVTPTTFDATVGYETTMGLAGASALACGATCATANWPTSTIIRYTP